MSLSIDIEKKLGDFRLHVQFESSGGLLALLGASGSGKSVTLRCIAGLMRPDRGRIVLNGRTLFDSEQKIDLPPQKRRVGYLFQSCALIPHMTVARNVELGLLSLPRRERRTAALAWLERFRLADFADALPATLSGGERQRAALARTLAAEPEAILLDEPFSALDDYLKWQLELELARTLEDYGGDAILVTHSRDEVCRLVKTVCVLDRGRSAPLCSTAEKMIAPGSFGAALLSGCENLSPVTLRPDRSLFCEAWAWSLPAEALSAASLPTGLTHVGVRARSLRPGLSSVNPCPDAMPPASADPASRPGTLSLDCTVDRVIDNVFSEIVTLRTPGPGLLRMERDQNLPALAPGAPVTVYAAPEDFLLLTE